MTDEDRSQCNITRSSCTMDIPRAAFAREKLEQAWSEFSRPDTDPRVAGIGELATQKGNERRHRMTKELPRMRKALLYRIEQKSMALEAHTFAVHEMKMG